MKKRIPKCILLLVLALCLFVALTPTANAAENSGSCGENVTWLLSADGVLTISGNGAMTDYASASDAPWYSQRTSIKSVVIEDGVSAIGDRAFYSCTALTDVQIGQNVLTIGNYAFRGCAALKEVTVPACVAELKDSAFRACTVLDTVIFQGNAPILGNYVYNDCPTTITIMYYEGSTGFGTDGWSSYAHAAMHVGQWVVDIAPTCTTDGCRHIDCSYCGATITQLIPAKHIYVDGICSVCHDAETLFSGTCGTNAAWELDVLGTLTVSGTGWIGSCTSYNCAPWYDYRASIKSVVVQAGITGIGDYAFYGCSNLTGITIPDSTTALGWHVFDGCSSLTDVYITDLAAWLNLQLDPDYPSEPLSANDLDKNLYLNGELITEVVIPHGITAIRRYAFCHCANLSSLTIAESVTSIGRSAFEGCRNLPNTAIPESVTVIAGYAFYGCVKFTNITIPDSVTSIGISAFGGCSSLESITIPFVGGYKTSTYSHYPFGYIFGTTDYAGSVKTEQRYYASNTASATTQSYYIPASLKSVTITGGDLHYGAFYNCGTLTSITLPDNTANIAQSVFYNCSRLTSITLPESITSIESFAFSGCNNLTDVYCTDLEAWLNISFSSTSSNPLYPSNHQKRLHLNGKVVNDLVIPDSVSAIGDYAFCNYNGLTSLTIPDSVTSIGEWAFSNCSNLSGFTLPESVTSLGDYAFAHNAGLESITIPDSVETMGMYVFRGCPNLKSVTIREGTTSIGDGAFSNCISLTGISIPGSVTNIGASAFYRCTSLTSITIPDAVTHIGYSAFSGCNSLVMIKFKGGAPTIEEYALKDVTATAYYPEHNETWTSDVMQDYGGIITWTSYTAASEPTEPEPTVPAPTEPIPVKNGIILEDDGLYYYYVDGEIQFAAGLVCVDGDYYYIRSGGYAATGSYWVTNTNGITQEGFYIFGEDGKMLLTDPNKTGIYLEDGKYYYYIGGHIQFDAGLVLVDGSYYYIRSGGYAAIGEYYVYRTNSLLAEGLYVFGDDGRMIIQENLKNGVILEDDGRYYYYIDGEIQYAAGLVFVDGAYYYIRSGGFAAIGSYWVTNTNGITQEGFYIFGEDGKMLLTDVNKTGIYLEDGKYYYYIGGHIQFDAGLVLVDGSYYYIRSGGYAAIGEYYVIRTNGLLPEGNYVFGEDGKMIL